MANTQDLVVRLLGLNADLRQKLEQAKNQIKAIKKEANQAKLDDMFKGVLGAAGSIAKFTIGINSAIEVLGALKNSSQTISDAVDNNIGAMKDTVNEFFYAIANGDWSNFTNGFADVYNRAKLLREIMDSFGNFTMAYDFASSYQSNKISILRTLIKGETDQTKKKSLEKELEHELNTYKAYTLKFKQESENALIESLKAITGLGHIETSDIRDIFLSPIDGKLEKLFKLYLDNYLKAVKDLNEKYTITNYDMEGGSYPQLLSTSEGYLKELEQIKNDHPLGLLYDIIFGKLSDSLLLDKIKLYQLGLSAELNLANLQRRATPTTTTSSKKSDKKEDTSWYLYAIKQGNQSVLDNLRTNIELYISITSEALNTKAQEELNNTLSGELKLRESIVNISAKQQELLQALIKKLNTYANTAAQVGNSISSSFSSIGSAMEGQAALTMVFIGQLIGLIASVVAAWMAAAAARQAGETPWPLNLVAIASTIAAITAVIGAASSMASADKYETGGIVGGNSFYGDNVIARVNSGEMILNGRQQANLFNLINGGGSSGGSSGKLELYIKGDKLIGAINNTMRRNSKLQ